ncbi:MAG: MBOAT family protein, partial [Lachnospiraceae bacterium]|nr:MBOAT family protein [Lachnospiraceae bacterium]
RVSWPLFAITEFFQLKVYLFKLFPFFAGSGGQAVVFAGDFEKYLGMYGVGLTVGLVCCTGFVEKIFIRWRNKFWMSFLLLCIFGASVYCMYKGLNDPFLYYRF